MSFRVRTLSVAPAGTAVRSGSGQVTLVNRHATIAMRVAASEADLGASTTRDEIPAGESIEVGLRGRKDELWVASADAVNPVTVAVYEA